MVKKKEPKEVEIYSDMIYCPHCGAIQNKKENFCSSCGESLHEKKSKKEDKEVAKKEETPETKKKLPFYKNKFFWMSIGFVAIAVATIGGIFYLKMQEGKEFESQVKGIWGEVVGEAGELDTLISEMDAMEDFETVALEIKNAEDIVEENENKLKDIDAPSDYADGKDDLAEALGIYGDYLEEIRSAADNPSGFTNQDIEEIEILADDVKTIFNRAYAKLTFLDIKLEDTSYTIISSFQTVREAYENELEAEERAKAEANREVQEAAENKAKSEAAVTSFMNAYIAGNESELKKYMTTAFQKEFNYADLSVDARMYSYPESFRITTTKKTSDTQFDIYGRELQVNRESGSKWTINRHFAALYVKSESKWLIDRWDISTE